MPNWCQGVLKIRGPKERHVKFIKEGLLGLRYDGATHDDVSVPIEDWYRDDEETISVYRSPGIWIWIQDTHRAFIDFDNSDEVTSLFCENKNDKTDYISVIPIKQAWGIDYEEFSALAKKYELDMRVFAVEQGMGFWCDADIDKDGNIKLNSSTNTFGKSYNDFLWECPYPIMGG